jgi:outer membrane protein OmpA-like peptidoglycan-associated protein
MANRRSCFAINWSFGAYRLPTGKSATVRVCGSFLRENMNMLRSLASVSCMAVLLAACSQPPVQAVAPPPPTMVQAPSFMVFFDWDRSNLSAQAMSTIQQAASAYRSNSGARVTAVGHTDTSGPDDYNMALSLRRANTVKGALVQAGVPADAIDTIGKGEQGLLVATADGVREPQNRRVEILGAPMQTSMAIFQDPRAYCKALTDKWRQFRNSQVDTREAVAISKCEAGDYAAGIPVLEDALITAKMPLPAPGYRWPGRSYTPS